MIEEMLEELRLPRLQDDRRRPAPMAILVTAQTTSRTVGRFSRMSVVQALGLHRNTVSCGGRLTRLAIWNDDPPYSNIASSHQRVMLETMSILSAGGFG
ncbi:hypothetical protein MKL09_24525 [Methylobacterium sp. J-048]|uniref:hypothetical protein n=1 Tax=Methylobacterium sp. J-048 TaxID=2836635 RepID=UPI001FB9F581|nr:hypothetical protein [Methylobacterium sp. J-048]MCJ2059694.1 hypothetical protein [Methylobacterium sp. J-048]